jgi:hypothetical protein
MNATTDKTTTKGRKEGLSETEIKKKVQQIQ